MGTGKSTLGQLVAGSLNVPFFDTDLVIESQSDMTISGIFATQGEKVFRELEADVLRQTTIYDKALIATGGGLPCHHDNMQWMNEHGITMYISWPYETLKSHLLKQSSSRPLLADLNSKDAEDKIALLFEERRPYYEMAAMTLEMVGNLEIDTVTLEKACKYIW